MFRCITDSGVRFYFLEVNLKPVAAGLSLRKKIYRSIFYNLKNEFVIDCYADTIQKLLSKSPTNKHGFFHISDWLKALDKVKPCQLPEDLLSKAIYLKNELLNSMEKEILLHGDLHQDNILQHGEEWLVIDPKGIIGEPEFEVAAFDFIHKAELTNDLEVNRLLLRRIQRLAEKTNLSVDRIRKWVFVRLVLSAAWSLEDKMDSSFAVKLAKFF